ncbi:MAG: transglycosylase SLT domain-containing protein [Spirochaetes bacterium]|nr:transglycosylase SLT domain-containing protein [Spirochaetota bacterium]
MKLSRIFAITAICTVLVAGFDENLLSWGLFNFFNGTDYSAEGLAKAEEFDPDRDILYLPQMGGRDIFETMRDLSVVRKKSVRKYLYIYLTSGREYVKRAISRSYIHKDTVDAIFRENPDIPEELALLPLLESGYDPCAVSRSRATGLWQFVGNTSTPLGLKVNRWVDERRSVEKSTAAAIRHLRNLYRYFGRWDLSLAAYNGGSGHVGRAMAKSGAKSIWELNRARVLRNETDEYVSRYVALALIYQNQRLFGIFDEIERPDVQELAVAKIPFSIHLKYISEMTGLDRSELRRLNPELQRDTVPYRAKGYPLTVPASALPSLQEGGIAKLESHRLPLLRAYRVKAGDTISSIARRFKKKRTRSPG